MGRTTIEWATHTFNPWIGCAKVLPACDHCYAENYGRRFGVAWGALWNDIPSSGVLGEING